MRTDRLVMLSTALLHKCIEVFVASAACLRTCHIMDMSKVSIVSLLVSYFQQMEKSVITAASRPKYILVDYDVMMFIVA